MNNTQVCPWCGAEMEAGTWRSRGSNFFQPDSKEPASLYTESQILKHGGIPLPPSPYQTAFQSEWPKGFICRQCRKIVISYEE